MKTAALKNETVMAGGSSPAAMDRKQSGTMTIQDKRDETGSQMKMSDMIQNSGKPFQRIAPDEKELLQSKSAVQKAEPEEEDLL